MNSLQRKLYADAIFDLITSLDNDMQSITGQVDNIINDLEKSTNDDYTSREKCVLYAKQYASTKNEILGIEGYRLDYENYSDEITLLSFGSVNYGSYVYGGQSRYITDVAGIYTNWFKRYGEYGWSYGDLGNRARTFKTGKCYPEGNLTTSNGESTPDFEPNIYPERYLIKVPNSGLLYELGVYRASYSIIGQGVPFEYKTSYYRTIKDKPNPIKITHYTSYYSYSFVGDLISDSYWSYDAYNSYWTGNLQPKTIIPLYTENNDIVIFAKVSRCRAYWETVVQTYTTGSGDSTSVSYYYYKRYHIDINFEIDQGDVPYYTETINGNLVNKYYDFYPMKKVSPDINYMVKFSSKVQSYIRGPVQSFYNSCMDQPDKNKYGNFLNIYSTNLNGNNYNIVLNNISSLESFLRYRASYCHSIWSDWVLANAYNDCLNDRLNKDDGSLKRWYINAVSIDKMEIDYYKKLNRKKDLFKKLLVQKPLEEFEGGNEMIIDINPSSYYKSVFSSYPEFNVGDTVYVRDDENNETMCSIIRKEIVRVQDTAEVQYETVRRNDGKTEQVAKLDENGEPISIYTYKNALKLTFNGNIPAIYDPDSLCIIKEL